MELNENDSNKKKVLSYAAFIGSFLILISGIIFLYILIVDNERNSKFIVGTGLF